MASSKYGVKAGEWWKHLRHTKRSFWKRHRESESEEMEQEITKAVKQQLKSKAQKKSLAIWPAEVLSLVAADCERGDITLIPLAMKMNNLLRNRGIGLAAPQIGVSKRLIVGQGPGWRFALINPVIVKSSMQTATLEEGCLSVPGVKLTVTRPKQITVHGFALDWKPVKIKARGLLSACLQHEIDHLNGITLANRPEAVYGKEVI